MSFVRSRGKPVIEEASWQSCGGAGVLSLATDRVSSARVVLNGVELLGHSDFRPNTNLIEVDVSLTTGANTLGIEVRGKPGSRITATISPVQ